MEIYIVFQDVPYEFGQIHAVFDSQEKAESFKDNIFINENKVEGIDMYGKQFKYLRYDSREKFDEMFIIQKWEVE